MRDLVIIGCGGHGREVLDLVEAMNMDRPQWSVLGFLDEDPRQHGTSVRGHEVLGDLRWFVRHTTRTLAVIGIGHGLARRRVHEASREHHVEFATLVHPTATLTRYVMLEPGAVITAGTVLTNNIHIGAHAHINIGATISHDCVIGPYVTVGPGAGLAGGVHVGAACEVGIGVSILPRVTVGEQAVIGAGAVVTRDIPAYCTAVGVPARVVDTQVGAVDR